MHTHRVRVHRATKHASIDRRYVEVCTREPPRPPFGATPNAPHDPADSAP